MKYSKTMHTGLVGFIAFPVVVTILGTVLTWVGLPFGAPTALIAIAISLIAGLYCKSILTGLDEDFSYWQLAFIWSSALFFIFLYALYSPVIEIRQDPSIYAYRAYALINTGFAEIDATRFLALIKDQSTTAKYGAYAFSANGTQVLGEQLFPDFLAGPSYLLASYGLLHPSLLFYGTTHIMVAVGLVLFLVCRRFLPTMPAVTVTGIFLILPLNTWFGRAPYAEPIALLSFLITFLAIDRQKQALTKADLILLGGVTFAGGFFRIDMFLVSIFATFWAILKNLKMGLALFVLTALSIYLAKGVYPVYMDRLEVSSTLFGNLYLILVGLSIIAVILRSDFVQRAYLIPYQRLIPHVSLLILILLSVFMFRDNYTDTLETAFRHGRVVELLNEFNIDRLSLLVPLPIILIGGIGFGFLVIDNKDQHSYVFFLAMVLITFGYFLYDVVNSPQAYWFSRRYVNVLVPIFFIGFVVFIAKISERNIRNWMLAAIALMALNLQLNSEQIIRPGGPEGNREMRNLDSSVATILRNNPELQPGHVLVHDREDRYILSSIGSMASMILISHHHLPNLFKTENSKMPFFYATAKKLEGSARLKCRQLTSQNRIEYSRLGESYIGVPKEIHFKSKAFEIYSCE